MPVITKKRTPCRASIRAALLGARRAILAATALVLCASCAKRAAVCGAASQAPPCAAQAACVAGRCQDKTAASALSAAPSSRRLVVEAEQIAWLRRDDPPFGVEGVGLAARPGQPAAAPLGRTSDGDAVLLLRFAVPLPPELTVVEAYVLLDRVAGAVVSVDPVVLHALRVVEPWRAEAASWPRMPRLEEVRAGETWVGPTSSHVVRVDVRDLVRRWRSHDPRDQGIALRARKTTEAGATFWLAAASPGLEAAFSDERPISPGSGDGLGSFGQAPRLELYVRAETPR